MFFRSKIFNIISILIIATLVSCGTDQKRAGGGSGYGSASGGGYYGGGSGSGAGRGTGGDNTNANGANVNGVGIGDDRHNGFVPIGDGAIIRNNLGIPDHALFNSQGCMDAAGAGKLVIGNAEVNFPSTMGTASCNWQGEEGATLAARLEKYKNMNVPAGRKLCYMAMVSEQNKFYYDDVFYLTLNNRVLMQGGNVKPLAKDKYGFRVYDWNKLRLQGQGYNQNGCADGTIRCEVPSTETNGFLEVAFDYDVNKSLLTMAREKNQYQFGMIVTGDDDPDIDCQHSGMKLKITYLYYE